MATITSPVTGTAGRRLVVLPSTPDQKPTSHCFGTVVRIRVGEGDAQEVFEIYKGLLKFYSGHFRAAIDNMETGRFLQDEENTIALPDEKVAVFKVFKSWLFTRDFGLDLSGKRCSTFSTLIKLWCFGDRRQIPLLQNRALTTLRKMMADHFIQPMGHYAYIYENSCH